MRKLYAFILIFICSVSAFAQFDNINIRAGTSLFPVNKLNDKISGLPQNAYANYSPALSFGAGIDRFFGDYVGIAANVDYSYTSKPSYTLNILNTSLVVKGALFRFGTISPYIFGGVDLAFLSIKQDAYTQPPFTPNDDSDSTKINFYEKTNRYPDSKLSFVPLFGLTAGAGVNVRLNEWFTVFGEFQYDYYFAKQSALLQSSLKGNQSNLITYSFHLGIRVDLY